MTPMLRLIPERQEPAFGPQLLQHSTLIGREEPAQLKLPDRQISRVHALIFPIQQQWYIQDLGSANATWVDGQKVEGQPVALRSGCRLELGTRAFAVQVQGGRQEEQPSLDQLQQTVTALQQENMRLLWRGTELENRSEELAARVTDLTGQLRAVTSATPMVAPVESSTEPSVKEKQLETECQRLRQQVAILEQKLVNASQPRPVTPAPVTPPLETPAPPPQLEKVRILLDQAVDQLLAIQPLLRSPANDGVQLQQQLKPPFSRLKEAFTEARTILAG